MRKNDKIRSQFCTCHNSWAVVTCAKLSTDWIIKIKIRASVLKQAASTMWCDSSSGDNYMKTLFTLLRGLLLDISKTATLITQTLGLTSNQHRSNVQMSVRCLIDVNPSVFVILVMRLMLIWYFYVDMHANLLAWCIIIKAYDPYEYRNNSRCTGCHFNIRYVSLWNFCWVWNFYIIVQSIPIEIWQTFMCHILMEMLL